MSDAMTMLSIWATFVYVAGIVIQLFVCLTTVVDIQNNAKEKKKLTRQQRIEIKSAHRRAVFCFLWPVFAGKVIKDYFKWLGREET